MLAPGRPSDGLAGSGWREAAGLEPPSIRARSVAEHPMPHALERATRADPKSVPHLYARSVEADRLGYGHAWPVTLERGGKGPAIPSLSLSDPIGEPAAKPQLDPVQGQQRPDAPHFRPPRARARGAARTHLVRLYSNWSPVRPGPTPCVPWPSRIPTTPSPHLRRLRSLPDVCPAHWSASFHFLLLSSRAANNRSQPVSSACRVVWVMVSSPFAGMGPMRRITDRQTVLHSISPQRA